MRDDAVVYMIINSDASKEVRRQLLSGSRMTDYKKGGLFCRARKTNGFCL